MGDFLPFFFFFPCHLISVFPWYVLLDLHLILQFTLFFLDFLFPTFFLCVGLLHWTLATVICWFVSNSLPFVTVSFSFMDASFIRGFYLGCLVLCPSFFRGKTHTFLIVKRFFFFLLFSRPFFPPSLLIFKLVCLSLSMHLTFQLLLTCSALLLSYWDLMSWWHAPSRYFNLLWRVLFIYLFIFHFPLLTFIIEVSCSLFYFVFLSFPSASYIRLIYVWSQNSFFFLGFIFPAFFWL